MCVLILLVASAVGIFIMNGMKLEQYEFIKSEEIETEYGVTGMVKDYKSKIHDGYVRDMIVGTVLCICSVIPMFMVIAVNEEDDFMIICSRREACRLYPFRSLHRARFHSKNRCPYPARRF